MKNNSDFSVSTKYENIVNFDCGFKVFNDYLKYDILDDGAVNHYIIDNENNNLIAYFSLLASCIMLSDSSEDSNMIPSIELKMFAIDKRYQNLNLSRIFIDTIEEIVEQYCSNYIGARALILYSVPSDKVVKIYEDCGFMKMPENFSMYKSYFSTGCISMYKPIDLGY